MRAGVADLDDAGGGVAGAQDGVHQQHVALRDVVRQLLVDQLLLDAVVDGGRRGGRAAAAAAAIAGQLAGLVPARGSRI